MVDIGGSIGDWSYACAINNSGVIVGYGYTAAGRHAIVWQKNGEILDLGLIGEPFYTSYAYGINESGKVSGYNGAPATEQAFFWSEKTGMIGLGTFGGQSNAYGINDKGQIAGSSVIPEGYGHRKADYWISERWAVACGVMLWM
jgi:probable HAF family extracellular repeat protein